MARPMIHDDRSNWQARIAFCREQADLVLRRASAARDLEVRQGLLRLAGSWSALARELTWLMAKLPATAANAEPASIHKRQPN